MLVLTRKCKEAVMVGGDGLMPRLTVTVVEIAAGKVHLGFEVDESVPAPRGDASRQSTIKDQTNSSEAGIRRQRNAFLGAMQ